MTARTKTGGPLFPARITLTSKKTGGRQLSDRPSFLQMPFLRNAGEQHRVPTVHGRCPSRLPKSAGKGAGPGKALSP